MKYPGLLGGALLVGLGGGATAQAAPCDPVLFDGVASCRLAVSDVDTRGDGAALSAMPPSPAESTQLTVPPGRDRRPAVAPAIFTPEADVAAAEGGAGIILAQAQAPSVPNTRPIVTPDFSVSPMSEGQPGVLTPRGVLVVEPSIQYTHTNVNTFVAGGVAILDTVLIGNIQATQANRDAITGTMAFRYGITNRLEVEARVPYMYRHDSVTNTVVSTNNTAETTDLSDSGIGDVEGAFHYQINQGDPDWPIFVGNLRIKSNSGTGPFDVARDSLGVPQQLATGSGFWGFEPSITMIAPSDPAVFYVNVGYLYNLSSTVNKPYNSTVNITKVDPGGAVRLGMGMGLALNEKVSFNIGYQEDFIAGTKSNFSDGTYVKSTSLSVGTLNLGVNWQRSEKTAVAINVSIGVTRDAPDVALTARVPISIDLFR